MVQPHRVRVVAFRAVEGRRDVEPWLKRTLEHDYDPCASFTILVQTSGREAVRHAIGASTGA